MILPQPFSFRLNISAVFHVVFGYLSPVVAEVTFNAVRAFQFQVGLLDFFQQGRIIPRCPIVNRGHVGGRAHGSKFLGVFLLAHILGLVYFQQQMGGVTHYIGRFIGGQKDGRSRTQADDVTHLGVPEAVVPPVVQPFSQSLHAYNGLGLKGG